MRRRKELTKENKIQIDTLAKVGATAQTIATFLGITRRTIYNRDDIMEILDKYKYKKFGKALSWLYIRSQHDTAALIFLLKCWGMNPKMRPELKFPEGASYTEKSKLLDKELFDGELEVEHWKTMKEVMLKEFEAIELERRVAQIEERLESAETTQE